MRGTDCLYRNRNKAEGKKKLSQKQGNALMKSRKDSEILKGKTKWRRYL